MRRRLLSVGVVVLTLGSGHFSVLLSGQAFPLRIVVVEGEDAVNVVQQVTAVAPVVEVRDRNDQPVSGALVRFAITKGRATFSGARALTVTTNAAGRAAVTGLAPTGAGTLQISATAAFQGQTAIATIVQTNVMTAAEAAAAGAGGATSGAGASAGGAAGGGTGGGMSATTLGVVGGAVAGGTIVATQVVGATGSASKKTIYRGPFTIPSTYIFQESRNGVQIGNCASPMTIVGTLEITIDDPSSETLTGHVTASWTQNLPGTVCGREGPFATRQGGDQGDIRGTASNVQFTHDVRSTGEFRDSTGSLGGSDIVATNSFSGTLGENVITGTWTMAWQSTLVTPVNPGQGFFEGFPTSAGAVVLTKQ